MTTKAKATAKATPKKAVAAKKPATCSVKGCIAPAVRRGMCSSKKAGGQGHYRQWLTKQRAA
ncbi:MAG: hypothetical protein WEA10_04945 [Actinomycetota bacterium]